MNPQLQQLAARRFGGSGAPVSPMKASEQNVGLGGLISAIGGSQQPQTQAQPSQPSQPSPGISGITPGAVERQLGSLTPPSQQLGGMGAPPSQAFNANPQRIMNQPNMVGPAREQITAPLGNLENFLRRLQNGSRQE